MNKYSNNYAVWWTDKILLKNVQMANKYIFKKCSTILVIGKMKTKTAEIPSHPSQDVYRQGNK